MPKGVPNKRYTPEFKQLVVETMREERLSYSETERRFDVVRSRITAWERIYLEEGADGFRIERRGRGSTGRPKKLSEEEEEDLLAEVQRLRAENGYSKNLQALVLEDERRQHKKTQVVQKLRQKHSLELLLSIAQLPRATFYYHLKKEVQTDKYKDAKEMISAIYSENKGRYGYRRITTELRNRNLILNHKTVQRLIKELGLGLLRQNEEISFL